jgi:hypothetical protein
MGRIYWRGLFESTGPIEALLSRRGSSPVSVLSDCRQRYAGVLPSGILFDMNEIYRFSF